MSASADRATLLRRCELFAGLAEDAVAALAAQAVRMTAARGETLFRTGDPADGLRILSAGLLRVWIDSADGREHTLALVEPGDALGEIALLDGMPRTANVTVLDDAEMVFIRRSAFMRRLEADNAMKDHFIALLCGRLRMNTDEINDFAFLPLRLRIRRKLHALALSHAVMRDGAAVFRRGFSQSDLAGMLGVTREAVNKQLAALAAEGVIETRAGRLAILDLDALAGG